MPAAISARLNEGALKGSYYSQNIATSFETTYVGDYNFIPLLADVAGTYNGVTTWLSGADQTSVIITPEGFLTGMTQGGCSISGVIHPDSTGNLFNAAITQGDTPCGTPHQLFQGVVYSNDANTIYVVLVNAIGDSVLYFTCKK